MSRKIRSIVAVTVLAALITAASAFAGKPSSSSPTLTVSFPQLASTTSGTAYGTPFIISGCGYGSTYTSVVVTSPEALSFAGQSPDVNGCISFDNFSTNLHGQYQVNAYQEDSHGHTRMVASTTFTVS
jgi:hypothetical protein